MFMSIPVPFFAQDRVQIVPDLLGLGQGIQDLSSLLFRNLLLAFGPFCFIRIQSLSEPLSPDDLAWPWLRRFAGGGACLEELLEDWFLFCWLRKASQVRYSSFW